MGPLSTQVSHWFPGGKLGRYVLISPLASGGMAEIWLARQPGLHGFEKIVVIKRMISAIQNDPDHIEMFLSEARLAATLTHRYVVQVYELGEDHGAFYIVMEFIEGETLARVFRAAHAAKQPVPVAMAVQLIACAAEALHYAHTLIDAEGRARGILHRDVSPHNLLVTADGAIKLVDFGIARAMADATFSGRIKGKITYMAPEQARGDPLDPSADVFGLGVVLFELVTNTRLFGGLEDPAILKRLRHLEQPPKCSDRLPGVAPALDALVARAMAPRCEDRFRTARELQVALEDWLAATGQRASPSDIAGYLNQLFPERAAERRALLEAARNGEPLVAPRLLSARRLAEVATPRAALVPDQDLIPTNVSPMQSAAAVKRRPRGLVVAVVALLIGATVSVMFGRAQRTVDAAGEPDAGLTALTTPTTLVIESTPEATALLDGVPVGSTPLALEELALGEHEVVLNAEGFLEHRGTVTVRSEGERLQPVLALEKDPAALHPPVADGGLVAAVKVKPPRKRAIVRARGKLNLRTTPWTTIYLGKRRLGDTPLVGISLPVGRHVLRVINAEAGVKSSIEIVIRPNQTTNESLALK